MLINILQAPSDSDIKDELHLMQPIFFVWLNQKVTKQNVDFFLDFFYKGNIN